MTDPTSIDDTIARIRRTLHNRCDPEAACITVVAGRGAADVRSGFRVRPKTTPLPRHRVPPDVPSMTTLDAPGGTVAFENDGFSGSLDATLVRLSRGTRAAAVYWNGIGDIGIGFAHDGAVLHSGDALPTGQDAVPAVAALFDGLDAPVHGVSFCGLIAVERFTDVRIDGEPLAEPAAVYPLAPAPDRLMPGFRMADLAGLVYEGDEDRGALSGAIAALAPVAQRRLAAAAAQTILRLTGRLESPEISEAVRWLTHPSGPRFSEPVEIDMMRAHKAESRGSVTPRSRALRVLATAAGADPHLAALEAIWAVREALAPGARPAYDETVRNAIARESG